MSQLPRNLFILFITNLLKMFIELFSTFFFLS